MPEETAEKKQISDAWYAYLTGTPRDGISSYIPFTTRLQFGLFGLLPGAPRCLDCNAPLEGVGARFVKIIGFGPSALTPRLCNACEKVLLKAEGGAEVQLSMLFADVRGSTELAEKMSAAAFSQLIQRFYKVTTDVLIRHNALVNRLMGDQVIGLFVARFAGANHAGTAIQAALDLLRATGHAGPEGPWVPVGASVHTGQVYVGAVGSKDSVSEIAVLGNEANLAARLSAHAGPGELVISEASAGFARLGETGTEARTLVLKGIRREVPVRVVRIDRSVDLSLPTFR
jgi:adenylate cyclase